MKQICNYTFRNNTFRNNAFRSNTFRSNTFRNNIPLRRLTAWLVLFFYSFALYSPFALAARQGLEHEDKYRARLVANAERQRFAHSLQKLQDLLLDASAAVEEGRQPGGFLFSLYQQLFGEAVADEYRDVIQQLAAELEVANAAAEASFETTFAHLKRRGVSAAIKRRHQEVVKNYKARVKAIRQHLNTLKYADGDAWAEALSEVVALMEGEKFRNSRKAFNPTQLPFGNADRKVRQPQQSRSHLQAYYHLPGLSQMAALNNEQLLDLLAFENGPVAADLEDTADAQLSGAIIAKAAELNHDPVAIYTWVHNTIRYVPSFGSIQGADYTLQSQLGNAMDTASLLVALLRAADIPARYVHGTVRIPVEQVMNWVGGAETPQAALELLSRGGIPNRGLSINGEIRLIELEHTWVEAWVDFEPSRGLNNLRGDRWVPMDASFKQYQFASGMKVRDTVPFDAQSLVYSLESQAVVNEQDGWVQNVPQAAIDTALSIYQQQLENYINAQNPEATVADVLGRKSIELLPVRPLSAGLPYDKVLVKTSFSEVSNGLRHKFRIRIDADQYGTRLVNQTFDTLGLAGKKLSISFNPATQDDSDLIASFLPQPDENGEIDPNLLPDTLPGYLIAMNLVLSVDAEVIATVPAGTMGSEVFAEYGLWDPDNGWFVSKNPIVVGEFTATALDLQGISSAQARAMEHDIQETRSILESGNATQLATLTKQRLVGDLLHATVLSYFALNDVQDQISSQAAGVLSYRGPSYGHFKTALSTSYWFGIPRDVTFDGLLMDIDAMKTVVQSKTSDRQEEINFLKATGARTSAMEHLVPEQMYSTDTEQAQGISAVKAIALAAAEGQRVYTITQANLSTALSQIFLEPETEQEISNAVNSGLVVTTHQGLIDYAGWTGAGYIIEDPITGAGAYKISGGSNGGHILFECGVVCEVINNLLYALSVVADIAGTMEEYLRKIESSITSFYKNSSRLLGNIGILIGVFEAIISCNGTDILIVLVPVLLLSVLLPLMLGSGGLGLVGFIPLVINLVATWVASKSMEAMIEDRCL